MIKLTYQTPFILLTSLFIAGCDQPIDLSQIKDLTTQGISAYKDINGSVNDAKDATNTTLCPQTGIIGDRNTYRVNEGRYALANVKCVSRQSTNVTLDIVITYENNNPRSSYQRNDPTNLVLAAYHQNGTTENQIASPILLNPRAGTPNVTVSAVKFTLPNTFDIKNDQIICGFQSPYPGY